MNNKRYDDALKRAEAILKVAQNQTEIYNCIITIFPELKESEVSNEDEKIRRAIIEGLKEMKSSFHTISSIKIDDAIAWIEKQGEQKHKFIIGDIISNNNVIYRVDNIVKNCIGQDCYFLVNVEREKNGTRYLIMRDSEGKTSHMGEITWLCDQVDAKFEKQGEKLTDKVQPKFKVGDWVVYNRNDNSREILQVYDIRDDRYYFTDNVHFSWSIKECDERSHLWTIQDAKDGDVLATSAGAFIYNGNDGGGSCPGSYCGINTLGKFQIGVEKHWTGKKVYPATKEQCNTLEKAMADAGYMFDVENKELMTY